MKKLYMVEVLDGLNLFDKWLIVLDEDDVIKRREFEERGLNLEVLLLFYMK